MTLVDFLATNSWTDMGIYSAGWKDFRKIRNGLVGWAVGGILLFVWLTTFSVWQDTSGSISLAFPIAYWGLWATGIVYFYFQLMFFRCPRCKAFFASRGGSKKGNSWLPQQACNTCGLRKYEED